MDSFIKDLVLLALILFLFAFRNRVKPVLSRTANIALLLLTAVAAFGLQWYVLKYLPVTDCLPYKKGNNILEKRKIPPGAIPDSTVITFVYNKNGKDIEFTADKFPADFNDDYKFVKRYDKLIRKGNAEAAIKDFTLNDSSDINVTDAYLSLPGKKLLVFVRNVPADVEKVKDALPPGIPFVIVTSTLKDAYDAFSELFPDQHITYFTCDGVAVKTASRAPITIYLLDGAVIKDKWSYLTSAKTSPNEAIK